ncbi:transglutaminase-like cysteine peptidase [Hyphomicrobium sp.]|uniref:transglutaminase-like cysteine peptidase n=1 Tax=Hyphomicrobium sp. TaxID=82 RepID=UPI0022BDC523|nr:transglutaminase-like cysteine peptidase [Hyphomicrobium sp.]MCZ7593542.1 transglutaminase-like cysteine peptidase [Hyphomicrobium sp.]
MQRVHLGAIVLIGGMLASSAAWAQGVSNIQRPDKADGSSAQGSPFMRIFGPAQPPHGFVRFCEANPHECSSDHSQESRFDASVERLKELDEINRTVNREVAPATDLEVYGVNEYWTLPRTRGDCEDYALQKRHNLIRKGWPVSALLLTVVRDEKGEGHAVLTARTVQGDYILDNKIEDVRVWSKTPYQFVMRQSYLNPKVWVALDTRQGPLATSLSGLENESME